jgi:hypothetical protein
VKVGDLIKEKIYPEVGLLVKIKDETYCRTPYGILCPNGNVSWFTKAYIEEECEIVK